MKKQVCSSLLALIMTLGTVTPALATETETNVQSAACTCTAACTEATRNMDCAVCGAEGALLTDCAQVNVQDDTNNEQQTANAENGFEYTVTGDEATITGYTGSAKNIVIPSELGGKPVTAIADKAFEGYKNIVNIYIPKTIKAIGEDAFLDVFDRNSGNLFVCYQRTKNEWGEIEIQEGNDEIDLPDNSATEDGRILHPKYECNLSGDMVYQASDDAATLVRYFGSDSKVDIPAELGGKPVTEIGELAFTNCSGLTEVTIPEGVTSIKDSVFQSCSSLTEVTIPKSVTSIETYTFYNCGALATVYYGGTQEDWDALKNTIDNGNDPLLNANIIYSENSSDYAYSVNDAGDGVTITLYNGAAKKVIIPSELGGKPVTAIGNYAFQGSTTITSVIIPKGITSIGNSAFQNCPNLTEASIPEGVTSIEESTFYNCKNLMEVSIPKTVESIGDAAFSGCDSLKEITLPKSVTSIGANAFGSCHSLMEITIPEGVTRIEITTFYFCESLKKVSIPETVTFIGDNAFDGCSSLKEVTIPKSVTSIGGGVFGNCSSLKEVTIPEGVKNIEKQTFYGCSKLEEITIPKSVTSIGDKAFYECKALTTVHYGGTKTDWGKISIGSDNDPLLNANIICKEKPKICKGGKEVKISNGAHEMRIHGKSYGTFTFAWVNDKAGWSIQNADGKYLSFDNGKLVLRDTAYVWKYDAKFYTTTEEKTSSGWGWWGRPSTKVTNWYLVGDGTDLSISKSDTNADVKLYDAMESTEHSFGKWTPAEDGKHTRTCTICGATETGDCTYENGACTVCGALDPDNASVSVSATVTKRTSGGGGWWWWNRPTTTTWEARITATGTGVDIDKVEYSDDGKHYLTGTSFTSDTEITKFYIRVTDSKGNVTNWLYENGKVTQK